MTYELYVHLYIYTYIHVYIYSSIHIYMCTCIHVLAYISADPADSKGEHVREDIYIYTKKNRYIDRSKVDINKIEIMFDR